MSSEPRKRLSPEDLESEGGEVLPAKEVMSVPLLDLDVNADLALALAAPIDLAVAGNLNVAAPIDAAASANVLSLGSSAGAVADQGVLIDQVIDGQAIATGDQDASLDQTHDEFGATDGTAAAQPAASSTEPVSPETTSGAVAASADPTQPVADATQPVADATQPVADATQPVADATQPVADATQPVADATQPVTETVAGTTPAATDAVTGATGAVTDAVDGAIGTVDPQQTLNGALGAGLLDVDANINLDADLAAPVAGAVAVNANVAAPIDAAVAANIGTIDSEAVAVANQQAIITQHMNDVTAEANADQDADIKQ